MSHNFFRDNDDLRFYIEKAIDWPKMVELVERKYKAADGPKDADEALETYHEIFELVGEFVAKEVAPRAPTIDREGNHMVDGEVVHGKAFGEIFSQISEMGLFGMALPREVGGLNLPTLTYFVLCELFSRGEVSVMTHFGFHAGVAMTLLQYSLHEGSAVFDDDGALESVRFQDVIEEIVEGKAWGSMDLTEPQAGSDLAALRSKAVKDDDGVWRVSGNKIFITSGDAKYHLVIAKTEDRDSLDAISLFLVPLTLERDGETVRNAYVDRVEEKIGHHGSPTCSIQYENSEGYLIGKEGEGFKLMLMLMNNARIGVGFEAIGTCEAAYRQSSEYAAERISMGKPIARHEMIADYLDEMDITIRGLRALAMEGAVHEELATRTEYLQHVPSLKGDEHEARRTILKHRSRSRHVTPLLKYAAAEAAVWMTRMNMQIHGGNGYTQDYEAERLLRDSLVLPVYEGTSQIQALMALKDNLLGAMKKPQRFLKKMAEHKLGALRGGTALERRYHGLASNGYTAMQHILFKIAKDKWTVAMDGPLPRFLDTFLKDWDPKRDFAYGLLHAERLTRILVDMTVAEILVDQASRFPEREEIAERWLERAEPRVRHNLDLIQTTGDRLLAQLEAQAEAESSEAA